MQLADVLCETSMCGGFLSLIFFLELAVEPFVCKQSTPPPAVAPSNQVSRPLQLAIACVVSVYDLVLMVRRSCVPRAAGDSSDCPFDA